MSFTERPIAARNSWLVRPLADRASRIAGVCLRCWTACPSRNTFCSPACYHAERRVDPESRFWAHVEKSDCCWLWTASSAKGYGRFNPGGGPVQAHRWLYELVRGAIPTGLELDHLCRIKLCVNPDHLEAVPHKVNLLRGNGFSAIYARRSTCRNGHPYTPNNTILTKRGRRCITCEHNWYLKRKARKWRSKNVL